MWLNCAILRDIRYSLQYLIILDVLAFSVVLLLEYSVCKYSITTFGHDVTYAVVFAKWRQCARLRLTCPHPTASVSLSLIHNDIRASCNICNRIRQVAPVCTLGPWVLRVYTKRRLHHFVIVQLFNNSNSCAQVIHRIRQVAPLCIATWRN